MEDFDPDKLFSYSKAFGQLEMWLEKFSKQIAENTEEIKGLRKDVQEMHRELLSALRES